MAFGLPSGLTGASLGSLIVRITADNSDLDRGLNDAERKVNSSSQNMSASVDRTIRVLSRIGIGIAAVGALSAKVAIDFESAFAGVRKTVDATEEEFEQLRRGLIETSKVMPITARELARVEELAGQLGIRGVENLQKFTETVARVAVTTNVTSEEAAVSFARIANIIQLPLSQIDRFAAALVDVGNKSATTEAEILDFVNRIAGAGQVVGLSAQDLIGIGAAFSSVGVQAERGGTAVSKALIRIGTAVAQGNEDLELFAEISGQTVEEFTRGFQEDAAGAFARFIEGLGRSGLKGAEILQELELGDQRLVQSFLSVGGAGGLLVRSVDNANKAFQDNIALVDESNKRFETTASQLEILKNNFTAAAIELGGLLLPAINDSVQKILETFQLLNGEFERLRNSWQDALTIAEDPVLTDMQRQLVGLQAERDRYQQSLSKQPEFVKDLAQVTLDNMIAKEERLKQAIVARRQAFQEAQQLGGGPTDQFPLLGGTGGGLGDGGSEDPSAPTGVPLVDRSDEIVERATETQNILDGIKQFFHNKDIDRIHQEANEFENVEQKKAELQKRLMASQLARLESVLAQAAQQNKAAAVAFKAVQLGRSIINTSEGITEALPNIPLALLVGAIGAAEIATILSTGFAKGTDSVPSMLTPGEMVIPNSFADAIREGRLVLGAPNSVNPATGGGGQTVHVEHLEINVHGNLDEEDAFTLSERLGSEIAQGLRGVS